MAKHTTISRPLHLRTMVHSPETTDINHLDLASLQHLVNTAQDRVTRNTAALIIQKCYTNIPQPTIQRN